MKYYSPEGKQQEFDKNRFINEYKNCYYLDNGDNGIPLHKAFHRVSVNSKNAEDILEMILSEGIRCPEDVDRILAWKIGGIDHEASKSRQTIRFISSWEDEKSPSVIVKNGVFIFECDRKAFKDFCVRIYEIAQKYEKPFPEEKVKSILNDIVKATGSIKGFGPVYILTLLYFLTRGQSPIFDRCAYKAVKAIYHEKKPKDIWYENPTSKSVTGILKVISDYEWYLERVFGVQNIDRDTDRALWVYGHSNLKQMGIQK